MTENKRRAVRVPLDLSPEQYEAYSEFIGSLPGKSDQQKLRRILGEAYTAKTGKVWPNDPVMGNQKVRED